MKRVHGAAAIGGALVLLLTACGGAEDSGGNGPSASGAARSGEGTLTVYAAASLRESFDRLVEEFEADHPDVDVMVDYAGSSGLVQRLREGARADVFASADERTMQRLTDSDLATGEPEIFATNALTLVVPSGNPADIHSIADLQDDRVAFVECAPEVPCGAAAEKLEKANGVELNPVSSELSVTDVLGKVTSGQADAGFVYVSDALAAGDRVESIDVPHSREAVNHYPVVTFPGSSNESGAQEFVDLLTGERGQEILRDRGFGAP